MPVMGGSETRDSATKLGALLADVTAGLSAAEIHAAIVARLQQPAEDVRLASLIADEGDFATMWTALAQGEPLPQTAWETVVLPAIVAYSDQQGLKTNLERATSLWLSASEGSQTVPLPPEPADGEVLPVSRHHLEFAAAEMRVGTGPVPTLFPTIDIAERVSKQRWPRSLIALALVALFTVGGFWWVGGRPASTSQKPIDSPNSTLRPPFSAEPDAAATATPGVLPTPGAGTAPEDPATPSTLPPPPPTWVGPGPAIAPSAPTGLTVKATTSTTVALAWQVPANPGSGEISYYRVFRDGNDSGWTDHTSATIKQLTPGVGYAFHVVAYNTAGAVSAASEVVSVTTASTVPTAQPPTGAPAMLRILPQPSIRLGDSFTVAGRGWPCGSPAEVRILLGGQAVAIAVLDSQGAFNVAIEVDSDEPNVPHVHALVSGEAIPLAMGQYTVTAELAAQASCASTATRSTQVTFRA